MGRDWNQQEAAGRAEKSLWGLVLAVALIGWPRPAGAQASSQLVQRAELKVTLRVYNYGISPRLLSRAEDEASAILRQAGLEAAWLDCPLTKAEFESHRTCQDTMGPAEFAIKILNAGDAERFSSQHEALGQALECTQNQAGCSAYIFYRGVLELARDGGAAEYQLLGHALAHEIGHLLLGQNSHSPDGIMQAHWGHRDLQTIAVGRLAFSKQQSERIRGEVSERNAVEQDRLARTQQQ